MNFIKDSFLHLRENALATKEDERVIAHGKIQICGNVHRLLPTNLSRPLAAAFIASPDDSSQTCFTLILGGLRLALSHAMTLHPSLEVAQRQAPETHDHTISITTKDGKYVIIKLDTLDIFTEWHKSLCDALAEMIFTNAFAFNSVHILSPAKLEVAMKRASRLVPPCNCHMLRAKRLWNIKMELLEILHRLDQDITSLTKEHVHNFLAGSDVDRLIAEDADFLRLKEMEPNLPFSLPASMMHEDLTNVTLTTEMPDHASRKNIQYHGGAPSPIARQEPRNTTYSQISYCHANSENANTHQTKVAPTISDNCQIFEESDLHWDICSPEKQLSTQTKCLVMVDQGTDTADLSQPALSPPSSEEKSKTDVYKQIDEIIDLLSEFSPAASASSFSKSKREELTLSALSLSPSATSSVLPPVTEEIKKGVFDAIDEVVDKFANSCHAHNSMCMMSRIEGDPSDPNHSILDFPQDMDTPSSIVPIFSHLPENQPSILDSARKERGVDYSPAASPPSSPFEPDEILSRCTFTMDDKMTPLELLNAEEEAQEEVIGGVTGEADENTHEKERSLQILTENLSLSPVPEHAASTPRAANPPTPRSSVPKTPLSSTKHKRFNENSSLADGSEAFDKENCPNDNVETVDTQPESIVSPRSKTMSASKTIESTETLNYSTMSSSAVGNSAFVSSGLNSSQVLYGSQVSFFSVDHSFSFYNISSSTIAEEDSQVSEEAEISNMEELEDRKLSIEHISSSVLSPLIIKVRESPVTISLQRSQKAEAAAMQQRELSEKLSRKTELRALAILLILVLAVLLCGAIVLRDVYDSIKSAREPVNMNANQSYNVSYTLNSYVAPSCQQEDVTLMTVLSASAKPLAKRASGALLAVQVFLAASGTNDVVAEAAKKLWNLVKFSAKGLIRVVTLMPQKHSDMLMSW